MSNDIELVAAGGNFLVIALEEVLAHDVVHVLVPRWKRTL